jgi:methylated-DNA-[protein]-cysteine S-methyltransferase
MTRRTLRAGPFVVEARVEGAQLRAVNLPKAIPEGLTAAHLRAMLAQLGEFAPGFGEAPPFYRKVWQYLRRIPWGSALTYAALAAAAGSPRAFRAVGQACAANPMPLIVPCHRVLAQDGIGGFSGGLPWKYKLLELESETFPENADG